MKKLSLILLVFLAGCAADPANLDAVAVEESTRLPNPSKPLSAFSAYELMPFVLSPAVTIEDDKVQQAAILEQKVKDKLLPLFADWSSSGGSGRSGTLIVQPELIRLKIVSGGARFWVGAFAGESSIDVDLRLTDGTTNEVIAKPRITKDAGAWAGGWSIGQSDQNLHDYIAHIIHQYMFSNFGSVAPVSGSPLQTRTSSTPSAGRDNAVRSRPEPKHQGPMAKGKWRDVTEAEIRKRWGNRTLTATSRSTNNTFKVYYKPGGTYDSVCCAYDWGFRNHGIWWAKGNQFCRTPKSGRNSGFTSCTALVTDGKSFKRKTGKRTLKNVSRQVGNHLP